MNLQVLIPSQCFVPFSSKVCVKKLPKNVSFHTTPTLNTKAQKEAFTLILPRTRYFDKNLCKRIRQKHSQFFINEMYKKYFICLPAFYLIIFLMKSPKNFEKISIFEMCQLVSFNLNNISTGNQAYFSPK